MSKRTTKHTTKEKLEIITTALEGRDSVHHLSVIHNLRSHTISEWIRRFQSDGMEGCKNLEPRPSTPLN